MYYFDSLSIFYYHIAYFIIQYIYRKLQDICICTSLPIIIILWYITLMSDDTNDFISKNNLRKLFNTLYIELDKLYAWLQSNKLILNLLKIHYMVFHRAKHKNMDVKLWIIKVPIQQVDNTTFLGVIVDDNLNLSNHTSYINSIIAKGIGIICRARKLFSKSALIIVYYLLFRGMG